MKFRSITVDVVNGNGRYYPREVVEKAIEAYTEKLVNNIRAFGEMGQGQTPTVNLNNVSHQILGFSWDNDTLMVEARIMKLPAGEMLNHLLNDGKVTISMSPRGLGSLKEAPDGHVVQDDYKIVAFDAIDTPLA